MSCRARAQTPARPVNAGAQSCATSETLPDRGLSDRKAKKVAYGRGLGAGTRGGRGEADRGRGCVSTAPSAWRNVRQGGPLEVFEVANICSNQVGCLRFGARFQAASELKVKGCLWLQIQDGEFAECWVRASAVSGKMVNCVKMLKQHEGRIPRLPAVTLRYAEGFSGSEDVCVISGSGEALWQEIVFEALCRDIASATFFEHGCPDIDSLDSAPDYAMNCVQFGELGSHHHKRLVAIVGPTPRWARFSFEAPSLGPPLEAVREDLGPLQLEECEWLWSMSKFLDLDWGSIEFMSSFAFLRTYCFWTEEDCQQAAKEKLFFVLHLCRTEQCADLCNRHFDAAWWHLEEAFASEPLPHPLPETVAEILVYLAATSPPELAWPPPESAAKAWSRIEKTTICALGPGDAASPRPLCGDGAEWLACEETREDAANAIAGGNGAPPAECTSPRWLSTQTAWSIEAEREEGTATAFAGVTASGGATSDLPIASASTSADPAAIIPESSSQPEIFEAPPQQQPLGCGIYVVGGRDGPIGAGGVWRFNAEERSRINLAPMSVARCQLAVAVLSGKLYALGGIDSRSSKTPISSVECFDPATGCWSECARMLHARSHFAAVALDNCLYAVGGICRPGSVERYEPEATGGLGLWTAVADLECPRCNLSAVLLQGKVYALGGRTSPTSARASRIVERLEPAVGTWTPGTPMRQSRAGHFACVVRGALYAVGGCRDFPGNLERYDPAADSWSVLPAVSQLKRGQISLAVCAGAVYVFQHGHLERLDIDSNEWTTATSTSELLVDFGIVGVEPDA